MHHQLQYMLYIANGRSHKGANASESESDHVPELSRLQVRYIPQKHQKRIRPPLHQIHRQLQPGRCQSSHQNDKSLRKTHNCHSVAQSNAVTSDSESFWRRISATDYFNTQGYIINEFLGHSPTVLEMYPIEV